VSEFGAAEGAFKAVNLLADFGHEEKIMGLQMD
jgi:hypothetical protein